MNSPQESLLWGVTSLYDAPNAVAMAALIALLLVLEKRYPRMRIRLCITALCLVLFDQLVWYLPTAQTTHHVPFHTIRLVGELLVGMTFLLYEVHPEKALSARRRLILASIPGLVGLEIIYGVDTHRAMPYVVCAFAAIALQFTFRGRGASGAWLLTLLTVLWGAVALLARAGCFRTAAYIAVGTVFLAAAGNLWRQLPLAVVGRTVMTAGLLLWSASLFIHSWVMLHPELRPFAEQVWAMQKFVLAFGMVVTLFEEEARENNYLAHHDALTGLANRRRLENQLQTHVDSGKAHVLLIDLDGFKQINDSFGHAAGDIVLREIGTRLLGLTRSGETLARSGGDEFILVSGHNLLSRRDAITERIFLPVEVPGGVAEVACSIGVAAYPEDARVETGPEAVSILLNVADRRMYRAKDQKDHRRQLSGEPALAVGVI